MPIHTAEVLHQVEQANVVEGGWVEGDAWFGSVAMAVEVYKRKKVFSTLVVKNNHDFFPMKVLHSVLKARHGDRPAGHWVTMTANIVDVPVIAVAYAWSQKGVSYFVSTCGSTEISVGVSVILELTICRDNLGTTNPDPMEHARILQR
jgi:hypothetical protein